VSPLYLWLHFQEQSRRRRSSSEKNQPHHQKKKRNKVLVKRKQEKFSGFLSKERIRLLDLGGFERRDMYIGSVRKSFKDSLKVLEADIQHANTL